MYIIYICNIYIYIIYIYKAFYKFSLLPLLHSHSGYAGNNKIAIGTVSKY